MNTKRDAALNVFQIEKRKAQKAAVEISNLKENEIGRALFWSAFLQSLKSSIGALVRFGMEDVKTRPASHRLKKWSNSDKMIVYLGHARNAEVHSDERGDAVPNPVLKATLNIGGIFLIEDGAQNIQFTNCEVNGKRLDGNFSMIDGQPLVRARTTVPVLFSPRQIQMLDVADKDGKLFKFPSETIPFGTLPDVFAVQYSIEKLVDWESEIVPQELILGRRQ